MWRVTVSKNRDAFKRNRQAIPYERIPHNWRVLLMMMMMMVGHYFLVATHISSLVGYRTLGNTGVFSWEQFRKDTKPYVCRDEILHKHYDKHRRNTCYAKMIPTRLIFAGDRMFFEDESEIRWQLCLVRGFTRFMRWIGIFRECILLILYLSLWNHLTRYDPLFCTISIVWQFLDVIFLNVE